MGNWLINILDRARGSCNLTNNFYTRSLRVKKTIMFQLGGKSEVVLNFCNGLCTYIKFFLQEVTDTIHKRSSFLFSQNFDWIGESWVPMLKNNRLDKGFLNFNLNKILDCNHNDTHDLPISRRLWRRAVNTVCQTLFLDQWALRKWRFFSINYWHWCLATILWLWSARLFLFMTLRCYFPYSCSVER